MMFDKNILSKKQEQKQSNRETNIILPLTYCVMLQDFSCYSYGGGGEGGWVGGWVCACMCVLLLFIDNVQRN